MSAETLLPAPNRGLLALIAIFALAGVAVSGVSLQRHYARSESKFCDIGEKFNCDIVNRSEYSSLIGIPVAAIGVAGYAFLFVLAAFRRSQPETPLRLVLASLAGLAFALYLTYVEGFVLDTWCILCLTSLGLIAAIAATSVTVKVKS
ncbi:MAG TPA: vitamin K epoxide reductase family protein [Candidatus Binatia bacterium]|nr:vitamin K epoxide reductase family protein [Candidatus Binatia bacterium]